MAKNPLITNSIKQRFVELPKSKGILDDYAVRKNVATREGTVEKVPVNNSDIVNKAYVDNKIKLTENFFGSLTNKTADVGFQIYATATVNTEYSSTLGFIPKTNGSYIGVSGQIVVTGYVSGSGCQVTVSDGATQLSGTSVLFSANGTYSFNFYQDVGIDTITSSSVLSIKYRHLFTGTASGHATALVAYDI